MMKRTAVAAAVSAACSVIAGPVLAQESVDEVVVTGIRGSLTNAMDIKRDSAGVVDAISAEDMGKFPDTNLAESLQRITGVSIDRVEGEGSQITVRGFGGQFNLVTLNGRQMPAANVQNVGSNEFNASGESRSFDFSVLASEGVSGLQVYKTGRASAPTGGIGATININTLRPLDTGTQFAVGAKVVDDAGSESGDLTPELSGMGSWVNDDETFGVSLFASYQERDGSSRIGSANATNNQYPYDPDNGAYQGPQINAPEPGAYSAMPNSTRIGYATTHRERTNAMLTLQFAPNDRTTITADALYTVNDLEHNSIQDQQYSSRNFQYIEWETSGPVAVPNIYVDIPGAIDLTDFTQSGTDILHDNRWVRQRDEMTSVGLNVDYQLNDEWAMNVDLASSESKSGGAWPGGFSYYRMPIAGAVSAWRATDMSRDVPSTLIAIVDGGGNQNGIYEPIDVSSQQARREASSQQHNIDQLQLSGSWDNGGNITVDFGVGRMESEMSQKYIAQGNTLGGWLAAYGGDIEQFAPGLIQLTDLTKYFNDYNFNTESIDGLVPAGVSTHVLGTRSMVVNPVTLWNALDGWNLDGRTPFDAQNPNDRGTTDNLINEDITSVYISATMEGEIGSKPMQVVAGLRYESTDVTSATVQGIPLYFKWDSDNDMTDIFGSDASVISEDHSYNNILPSLDFSVDLTDDLKLRTSFSTTIARPQYGNMFVPTSTNDGGTLTYLGGIPTASKGTPKLDPLESDNFDLSVEYYYGESNYAAVGYFQKSVSNFVGIEQVNQELFGLRDVTQRNQATNNRLNQAIAALNAAGAPLSELNLFTMTALIDNPSDATYPGGAAAFTGANDQANYMAATYDILPDSDDPFFNFSTSLPVNNQTANIDGFELAWQHFFGDSGFGFQANATLVDGDIAFDNAAPPTFDQFALEGLSDSANLILIWENDTFGARVAYNWRDDFLANTNGGNFTPEYYEAHSQLDVNFSWNVSENFSLSLDGINLTEEGIVVYGRTRYQNNFSSEYDARWVLAGRYNF